MLSVRPTSFKVIATALALLVILAAFVIWWTSRRPRRPKYLSPHALYIERAVVPFKLSSTPGDWLDCWFDEHEQLDHCKMTDDKGNPEFEDAFLPYEGQSPVSQDKLVFDTRRTGGIWIWVGSYEKGTNFPIVYLTNGEILFPRSEYEKAKQTVDLSKGGRGSP